MAKLSKQWGTIIGCWCMALVMVITGVVLSLTIPSSAAGEYEGDIAVMFDGETTTYHTMEAAIEAVHEFETTAENSATIKLLSNISLAGHTTYEWFFTSKQVTIDLNGHYVRTAVGSGFYIAIKSEAGASLTFTDSDPDAVHYCSYNSASNVYNFTEAELIAESSTPVRGGVIAAACIQIYAEEGGEINFQAGTYLSKADGILQLIGGKAVIENGVTWQLYAEISDFGLPAGTVTAMLVVNDSTLVINGGNIYGEIVCADLSMDSDLENARIVNLADPKTDAVKVNANMKPTEIGGVKVYQAVKNDDETETPITTPTEPIADAKEQPANNDNMVGLIVLGAAAVVVVVGVTTVILVMNKRRKSLSKK